MYSKEKKKNCLFWELQRRALLFSWSQDSSGEEMFTCQSRKKKTTSGSVTIKQEFKINGLEEKQRFKDEVNVWRHRKHPDKTAGETGCGVYKWRRITISWSSQRKVWFCKSSEETWYHHPDTHARAHTHTHARTQAVFFLRISKSQSVGCSHKEERRRCLIWRLKQNKAKHKLIQLGRLSHHQKGGEVVLLLPASTPTPLAELRSFLYSSDLARARVLSWFYLSTNCSAPWWGAVTQGKQSDFPWIPPHTRRP